MKWDDIRTHYPHQWLLLEAIKAYSDSSKRILEDISVVDAFPDSEAAMRHYTILHSEHPMRELYVFHTDREQLNITERFWAGVRGEQ